MDFKEWWNNIDRSESNTSRRNTKRNTAEDAWDHQQKEIDGLKKQLSEIEKYCAPHLKRMWAAAIMGTIKNCSFRETGKYGETS